MGTGTAEGGGNGQLWDQVAGFPEEWDLGVADGRKDHFAETEELASCIVSCPVPTGCRQLPPTSAAL